MNEIEYFSNKEFREILLKILNAFECATEFNAVLLNTEGQQIFPENNATCVKFCQIVQNAPCGKNKCELSYKNAGLQSLKYAEPYIFMCHAGILAFAAPILVDQKYAGIIICRNILMWEPDEFFYEELEEKNKGLNIKALRDSVSELKIVSSNKVHAAATLLYLVANQVVKNYNQIEKHQKEMLRHQGMINQEIKEKKRLHLELLNAKAQIYGHYEFENEKELLGKIAILDREGAYRALVGCITEILKQYPVNLELFKAKILEVMMMVSRTVLENGGEMTKVMPLNGKTLAQVYEGKNANEISSIACILLNHYLDLLEGKGTSIKEKKIVDTASEYIRENLGENLSLEKIADVVFVSKYYLSHIFKKNTDCTVIEYITKVKIEAAKKMLHNPQISISEISMHLGYQDTSYFTKVFKKRTQMTPSQFRKKLV
ncbi:MAG: PocR ligand-binding domain-containing protein [Eubacteriaceae bacterium]